MTKKNHWKQLAAMLMSTVLLIPAPVASAAETAGTQSKGQQEDIGLIVMEENRAADADGFEIAGGVLIKYTGKAKDVVIPDGVTRIGNSAFYECSSLTSITIPDSVTSIGLLAFYECSSLKSINIPDSVTSIEESAFMSCHSLKSITIPDSVTDIRNHAFFFCANLEKVEVNTKNKNYSSENGILYNKDKTTLICCPTGKSGAVTIPSGVTSIVEEAFADCINLTSITIPDGVTSIERKTFYGCNMKSITIPDSVTSIEEYAFSDCNFLTKITIPDSVTSIGMSAFISCDSLKSITISNNVTSIRPSTFEECLSLTSVTIPDSVTSIGDGAFSNCWELTSIEIPSSVRDIDENAFLGCDKLTIYGKAGSYAQTYAKKNKIPFSTGKPGAAKGAQSLKVTKTYSKAFGTSSFKLNAKLQKGNGTLTYASSAQSVATVDKKGNVTLKGTGIAIITVTAKETSEYKKADAKITITVSPAKPQAPTLKAQGGNKITVSWKADKNATGYEIQYSIDKKFKDKTTKIATVNKNKTISTTVKKLTKGKNYYVRVRTYKNATLNKKTQKLCSAWSGAKSVKVK